ncbi:hypothetical protein BC834DRAFT_1038490 [Gloeopeniophorella convolvens]|nr:hypothetical protein BC834DRAFT_1038490 [Gloeopeniophorella convolvens]
MFKAPLNPYDDVVVKTTDETLTVQDEGEQGARNVIAAVLKRLAHRNPNVQLYSLTLTEALSKNCGKDLHSEIASRAFTQALERLITDRTTHDKVRHRALMLIAMWAQEFENDPNLGIMEECYDSLKAKSTASRSTQPESLLNLFITDYRFEQTDEPPPRDDDDVRRREEEELQRVLELSMQDKGGHRNWNEYSLASSSGAGGSGSQASITYQPGGSSTSSSARQPPHSSGYVPSADMRAQARPAPGPAEPSPPESAAPTSPTPSTEVYGVTRVRALHTFEPTEPNELAFDKDDIIKVVNREYKDWWRGQLKGRTGIFPVNYVEPLPEPTVNELAAEAQQEAQPCDNDEIQELYRSCMTLRPKIVKLIDRYSQKRADLVAMNESFVRARTIFDRMMEDSLARHSEYYEQQRNAYGQPQPGFPRAESRAQGQQQQPQAVAQQGGPAPDLRAGVGRQPSYGAPQPQGQPQAQQAAPAPQPQPQTAYVQPYPAQDDRAPWYPQQQQQQQAEPAVQPVQAQPQVQPQHQQQSQVQPQPQSQHQQSLEQHAPDPRAGVGRQPSYGAPQLQGQPQPQQPSPTEAHPQQQQAGPPFVFDPAATYPDQNVQAWAQYYAQGGTDPTGAVYFFSVPGVTPQHEEPPAARANSLPNPYAEPAGADGAGVGSGPASAGAGVGAENAHAPWQQQLQGQFAQMRVGSEPGVGA